MATVAGIDSSLRNAAPLTPRASQFDVEPRRRRAVGRAAPSGPVAADIRKWNCLIVADAPARRDAFGHAAAANGWQVRRASRIDIAVRMATERRMRLVIVELAGNEDDSGLEELAALVARGHGLLVVLSRGSGGDQKEIRVRQLGAWLFGVGEVSPEELASVCAEARRLLEGAAGQPQAIDRCPAYS